MLTGDGINFQCNTFSINLFSSNTSKNVLYITNEDIALKLGVNFINSTGGQVGTISTNASMFYLSAPRTLMMSSSLFLISANSLSLSGSTALTLKKGSYNYSLPNKSGTIALTGDIPKSIDCNLSLFHMLIGATTISSGFHIYRNLSLNLSYGVLYCFCANAITSPGSGGIKKTAFAIGFRINESGSEDEEVYAIIAASNFNLGGYYEYPLKLK